MDKPMSHLAFQGMSLFFKLRDRFLSRRDVLKEADIQAGFHVLDYGCGPGGYVPDAAAMVGDSGIVYALDLHPLAVQSVQNIARRKNLENVKTILSDCWTGLPDEGLDVVLLYDVFHMLSDPDAVLAELRRVLRQGGILSFNDPHMNRDVAISKVTSNGLFCLARRGQKTLTFAKRA